MANNKTGFNYYRVDTDRYQDIKIKRLKKEFGCHGIAVYDYIICEIYRVQGCFLEWDESRAFDVAEYFGIKESLVQEIIRWCGSVCLFDKDVLTRVGVLTSLEIQSNFIEMSNRAKRSKVFIPEELKIIPEESFNLPEESEKTPEGCDNSIVKYSNSKVNKKKSIKEKTPFSPPTLEEVKNYFIEKGYAASAAARAFDYYTAGDWHDRNGSPVKNWKQKMISTWFKPENLIENEQRKKEHGSSGLRPGARPVAATGRRPEKF